MIRRFRHVLLLCVVLCALYVIPSYADDWEVYVPPVEMDSVPYKAYNPYTDYDPVLDREGYYDGVELINDLATDSNADYEIATRSNAVLYDTPTLYGSYAPYDSSISSSVVGYFDDVIPRLGANIDYVLFRSGQYTYRLVYADEMVLSGQTFTSGNASYVSYDTRYYTYTTGTEGSFTLRAGDVLVYSNLGMYPMLHSESVYSWILIFVAVVALLFVIYRSLFSPGRMRL